MALENNRYVIEILIYSCKYYIPDHKICICVVISPKRAASIAICGIRGK
jgi:hypothetical protein